MFCIAINQNSIEEMLNDKEFVQQLKKILTFILSNRIYLQNPILSMFFFKSLALSNGDFKKFYSIFEIILQEQFQNDPNIKLFFNELKSFSNDLSDLSNRVDNQFSQTNFNEDFKNILLLIVNIFWRFLTNE